MYNTEIGYGLSPYNYGPTENLYNETRAFPFFGGLGFGYPWYGGFGYPFYGYGFGYPGFGFYRPWFRPFWW